MVALCNKNKLKKRRFIGLPPYKCQFGNADTSVNKFNYFFKNGIYYYLDIDKKKVITLVKENQSYTEIRCYFLKLIKTKRIDKNKIYTLFYLSIDLKGISRL